MASGKQPKRFDRSQFLRELKEEFPDLRSSLNREHGLLHLEVHAFHRFAQAAIDGGDVKTVTRCFKLAERFLLYGNGNITNAIGVSFVEHLEFANDREWAWKLLPLPLKEAYEALCGKQAI